MLWRIQFANEGFGWVEVGTGRVFDDGGNRVTEGVSYSTTDTAPEQPGWYSGPDPDLPPPVSGPSWDDDLPDEYYWIDVGPFFDRFGAKALAITSSSNATVQGLVTLILPRKYVDLKRSDLPLMVGLLQQMGLIDAADFAGVMNPITTEAERHIKGLQQPHPGA